MGSVKVDQLGPDGELLEDVDTRLGTRQREALLLEALPGARVSTCADVRVVQLHDQIILSKQVTHLGGDWESFKKRIQIPKSWVGVELEATASGLTTRFIGVYHYGDVTVFVDFDPSTYVRRKANNSAAHVFTNDLHQAQVLGQFSRVDKNGNRLTSVRSDQLCSYLLHGYEQKEPRVEVFRDFNQEMLSDQQVDALDAIKEMHAADWPDTFQGEWPGFYLEHRLDTFLRQARLGGLVQYQKAKKHGQFDYDIVFRDGDTVEFYGDLKASDVKKRVSPGNDLEDITRCVREFGRFWYVVYEHETRHARDNGHLATIRWNEWKRDVGYTRAKGYDELSYSSRFKESVRFVKMLILEVNESNFDVVLGQFTQGRQPDGAARALKVMINKRNIDNFLIYSETVAQAD